MTTSSVTKQMISELFWIITRRVVVIPNRLFGTTYRFHLEGSRNTEFMTLEDATARLSRNVGKELPLYAA